MPAIPIHSNRRDYPTDLLKQLYRELRPRLIEDKILILLRQGRVSKQ